MSSFLEIVCRNNKTCRDILLHHGWSSPWIENPYMYLILNFDYQTTYVKSTLKPETSLLVYPEALAQLLLVDGDARDILIKEFYREQCEQLFRKSM